MKLHKAVKAVEDLLKQNADQASPRHKSIEPDTRIAIERLVQHAKETTR